MNQVMDDKLNTSYVSTHLGRNRSTSPDQLESYARHYEKVFLPHLPADRKSQVLEIGCGLGHFLYFLKKQGYNHWGIDIGHEQIEVCREQITRQVEWVSDTCSF